MLDIFYGMNVGSRGGCSGGKIDLKPFMLTMKSVF